MQVSRMKWAVAALGLALSLAIGRTALADNVLTMGNPFAPISLDPALSGNGRAGTFVLPTYEPLVRTKADGSFAPALATAWQLSPDNTELTFTLRQDAKFSDGTPVDAAAAKKSIEYWVGKKGPFSTNLATLKSIEVLGPYQFKIIFAKGNPNAVSLFDAYWLSGDLISPKGVDNPSALGTQSFGAGPYRLDTAASISGKSYTYVPNPYYYDKSKIHWDKVVISVFEDQNSAIQAMKAGQLNFLISDPLTGHANEASLPPDLRIIADPVQWIGLVPFDREGVVTPALKDVRVRQALNYAVDRRLMTSALFGKLAEPTDQIQVNGFMGYDAANEAKYPYDPAKAKALLAEAGYPNGFDMKTAYVNNTLSAIFVQALAGQLKKVGVNETAVLMQNLGAIADAVANRRVDSLIFNTNSGVPYLAKFQPLDVNGSINNYHNQDPALTKLLDDASALPIDQAAAAWRKAYGWVVDNGWFVPVSAVPVVYFVSNTVKTENPGQAIIIDTVDIAPAK